MQPDSVRHALEYYERYYMRYEILWLLKTLGYEKIDILGAKPGAFSREDKLTTEDFEMLAIAEKQMNARPRYSSMEKSPISIIVPTPTEEGN